MEKRKIAAFFDFDKTLLATDSASMGLRFLWDMGFLSLGYVTKALALNALFRRHLVSETFIASRLMTFYRGKPLAPFEDGVCEFYFDQLKPRLAPGLLQRLRDHQEQGHVTVLISGSMRYMLLAVIKDLGINHLLCSNLEVGADGLLTGRTTDGICIDANKARQAREFAAREGIDLSRSHAYGNHQSDIPLLSLVGHAYAVEPTGPLRKMANHRGWPILGFDGKESPTKEKGGI
ncbi:MAG: HAD-IB family hydrolase [Proteobacteria bacterium]|nr:HAD-IB family hydrolase [Pseudomonadota bacterium]